MENLKKLAKKILAKGSILHVKLKPKKGEMKALGVYLESVGFRLITSYYTRFVPRNRWHAEILEKRTYHIIKISK